MRKKLSATQKFESLIIKMADNDLAKISPAEIIKTTDAVSQSKEKMFWIICLLMGLKEGSTFIQGARKLRKALGI